MTNPDQPSALRRLAHRIRRRRQAIAARPKLAAGIVLLVLALIAEPFVRTHLEAAAVLVVIGNQPRPAVLRHVANHAVTTSDVTIPSANGPIRARLYIPVDRPDAPALLVLHGVHHLGMDEPRLIAFARALSSCGLRVLTPELPGIKDYHVSADSIRTIGVAAQWMATQDPAPVVTHAAGISPVGIVGLSFSGGLSLLAAADPIYKPYIKFVVTVGSQDEMARVATYYRTGEDPRPHGAAEVLPPHEYGALVLEYEHVEDFVPAADVAPFRAVLRAHLYEDRPAEKAALAALTPTQQAEAARLLDAKSGATRALLAASANLHAQAMAGVSPHGHLESLTVPVYLLHGEGDNIIPASETLWMASELPPGTLKAVLISPVLSHLDLDGAQPTAGDRWRLVHFFALILRAAHKR